jgi:hypothetical protein
MIMIVDMSVRFGMIVHQSSLRGPALLGVAMARAKRPRPDSPEPERVLAKTLAELEIPCRVKNPAQSRTLMG